MTTRSRFRLWFLFLIVAWVSIVRVAYLLGKYTLDSDFWDGAVSFEGGHGCDRRGKREMTKEEMGFFMYSEGT